ncbi:hypothetical protein [Marinoscillum sp. MHG1-6]|uniref:hypothetical protein n=1 Tax=Marinoscillum sp. MHG1-6 TaxID=2959627 RepID=UPI0021582619|nr:hypothetical protein [Marinoscillum sp. MHG1-6]
MSRLLPVYLGIFILMACSQQQEKNPAYWNGEWQAEWKTDPASFAGIPGITDFTMSGTFTFDGDLVSIKAYGFEGCVFSKDTLDHQLNWKISSDSLILINDEDTPGMVYSIKEADEKEIRLQLMDDIFLTLKK